MIQKLKDANLLIVIGPPAPGWALGSNENGGKMVAALCHSRRSPLGDNAQGDSALPPAVKKENDRPLFLGGRIELFREIEEIGDCLFGGDLEGVFGNFTGSWLSGFEVGTCEE